MRASLTLLSEISTSINGKAFLLALAFAMLSMSGVSIWGILNGEALASITFALMVGAIFVDIAVLIASFANSAMSRVGKVVWLIMTALALLLAARIEASSSGNGQLVLTYLMAILSFPAGYIAGPIVSAIFPKAGILQGFGVWAFSVIAGYVQWFKFLPLIARGRDKKNAASN